MRKSRLKGTRTEYLDTIMSHKNISENNPTLFSNAKKRQCLSHWRYNLYSCVTSLRTGSMYSSIIESSQVSLSMQALATFSCKAVEA